VKIKISGIADTYKYLKEKAAAVSDVRKREISDKIIKNLKDATPVDTGAARDAWKLQTGLLNTTSIVNDKAYVSDLNAGSSKQAPAHFIEQTVLNIDGVKPNGAVVKYDKPI
jgi:hypothetical protein